MNTVKTTLKAAAAAGLILLLNGCLGLREFREQIETLTITDIDFAKVRDGSRTGSYESKLVSAEVLVNASSGRIVSIDIIRHNHGKGKAAEAVAGIVVKEQTLMVDTVSSATYSSKVILKAIENALTGSMHE